MEDRGLPPECFAEIKRIATLRGVEGDVLDALRELLAGYEAQARELAEARGALEKISGAGAWDAAHTASEALATEARKQPIFRMVRGHADDCGWLHGSMAHVDYTPPGYVAFAGARGDCDCGAIVLVVS